MDYGVMFGILHQKSAETAKLSKIDWRLSSTFDDPDEMFHMLRPFDLKSNNKI